MTTIKMILAALTLVSMQAFAQEEKAADGTQSVAAQTMSTDVVKHREDLATHMGLSDQDALFGTPRDFRANHLNELSLEPLMPTITERN